ncbi:hypothetical protein GGR57DRAFT_501266 [Xylariaceae sp. FL1272]|nr:hypothetical protein GGR57DRAFT_501266 [Xylariaceae sp. FL1272]
MRRHFSANQGLAQKELFVSTWVDAMVKWAVSKCADYGAPSMQVVVAEYVPFQNTLIINTKGPFLVTRAVGDVMLSQDPVTVDLGRASIVNVPSAMSQAAVPAKAPYATSKHAMTEVIRAAAMDFKSAGIRVDQVFPTWVRTPMFEEECRRIPQTPDVFDEVSPLKRAIEPDEVAGACLYLCSPTTVSVTGLPLTMDRVSL